MATIHNAADKGQIAPSVLMPGDPKRAQYIAMNFLENPQLVSDVRGILCYTGTYEGKPVTVMGSGVGQGSMGIYSYELYNEYDVQRIIRVGTAGGLHPSLKLRDLVLGLSASTDSNFAAQYQMPGTFNPCCSFSLAQKAFEAGKELTVENVRPCTRLHKRCGTSFLLFVMLISMVVFFFVRTDVFIIRLITRICLVPFIAGISYEVLRWAGRTENIIVRVLSAPGLALQKLTTQEPDDSQIECAIAAMKGVLEDEPEE